MKQDHYVKVRVRQSGHTAVAWVKEHQAIIGYTISIPEVSGLWCVEQLLSGPKSYLALRTMSAEDSMLPPRARITLADPFPPVPADPFPGHVKETGVSPSTSSDEGVLFDALAAAMTGAEPRDLVWGQA